MRVGVIGTGHVGLVTAGAMASIGHEVVGVDSDRQKIEKLRNGTMPFYEPGMADLLRSQEDAGRLSYGHDPRAAITDSDVVFICVGTPPRADGSPNLSFVQAASSTVAEHATGSIVVAEKSTVPVSTGQRIREVLGLEARAKRTDATFEVVSNPEFLREGGGRGHAPPGPHRRRGRQRGRARGDAPALCAAAGGAPVPMRRHRRADRGADQARVERVSRHEDQLHQRRRPHL